MDSKNVTKLYSMKEVQKHDRYTKTDGMKSYWIAIHNKVYDVTKWLDDHPGGEDVLMENSGTDATEPWEDIGHSTEAREKMKQYLIGELRPEDRNNIIDKGPSKWASNDTISKQSGSDSSWNFNWIVAVFVLAYGYYCFGSYF